MAARAIYPTVYSQLGRLMLESRRRGVPFDVFWSLAVRPGLPPVTWRVPVDQRPPSCVVWPNDTELRRAERAVYADERVREGWRCAYERAPERPRDRALLVLVGVLSEDGEAVPA